MLRYGPGGFHHGPHVLGWLLLALLAALLILGIVALVRMWSHPRWRSGPPQIGMPPGSSIDPALNELRVRYARGDITWDEYSLRASNLGYPIPTGTGWSGSPTQAQPPPPAP
jgi:uncharacterized membrane protein